MKGNQVFAYSKKRTVIIVFKNIFLVWNQELKRAPGFGVSRIELELVIQTASRLEAWKPGGSLG